MEKGDQIQNNDMKEVKYCEEEKEKNAEHVELNECIPIAYGGR